METVTEAIENATQGTNNASPPPVTTLPTAERIAELRAIRKTVGKLDAAQMAEWDAYHNAKSAAVNSAKAKAMAGLNNFVKAKFRKVIAKQGDKPKMSKKSALALTIYSALIASLEIEDDDTRKATREDSSVLARVCFESLKDDSSMLDDAITDVKEFLLHSFNVASQRFDDGTYGTEIATLPLSIGGVRGTKGGDREAAINRCIASASA